MSKKLTTNAKIIIIVGMLMLCIVLSFTNKINNTAQQQLRNIQPKLKVGTLYPAPKKVPNFKLDATTNNSLQEQMSKKWNVVFFGYSHCPSLCPKTLQVMHNIAKLTKQEQVQYVFITIDPKRDTKQRLTEYLPTINPNFIGATGEQSEIKALTTELNIFVKDGDMTSKEHVDHSGSLVIISPQLELTAIFSNPSDPSLIARDLKTIQEYYAK